MREPKRIDGGKGDTNLQADSSEVVKGKTSDVETDPETRGKEKLDCEPPLDL
jgi:hypothetical protein